MLLFNFQIAYYERCPNPHKRIFYRWQKDPSNSMNISTMDPAGLGVCKMRIGSLFVFVVVTWICLGFLLSDDFKAHETLSQVQVQLDQATQDKKALQDKLNMANTKLSDLQQQYDQLSQKNAILQGQVTEFQGENKNLKSQNIDLQGQLDAAKKVNSLVGDLMGNPAQSLLLAIFVPVLPVSLVASFVGYRYSRRHGGRKPAQDNKSNRTMSINVKEEEMQQIVKMRRGR